MQPKGASRALSVRLPSDLHDDLAALARINHGSVASEVREAVQRHLEIRLSDETLIEKVEAEITSLNRLRERYGGGEPTPPVRGGADGSATERTGSNWMAGNSTGRAAG